MPNVTCCNFLLLYISAYILSYNNGHIARRDYFWGEKYRRESLFASSIIRSSGWFAKIERFYENLRLKRVSNLKPTSERRGEESTFRGYEVFKRGRITRVPTVTWRG